MATCDACGKHENLPYQCHRCGNTYCGEHRLPENHDCPGLEDWNDPSGVFDSGFDDSVQGSNDDAGLLGGLTGSGRSETALERLTSTGGALAYVRGNVAYLFLGLMWTVFGLQLLLGALGLRGLMADLFVLSSSHPFYVWTWVTSIFAHGGVLHIVSNSIVLFFFGPLVERYIGSKHFAGLFLVSGALAGLGFVGTSILLGTVPPWGVNVVGASGAIFAVLGVLTVLNPHLKIYLYFFIPVPLWLFTVGFALLSVGFILAPSAAAMLNQGNVAHLAHLVGLAIGLAYGKRVEGRQRVPDRLQFGGGRGGAGGPGGPGRGRGPF